MTEATDVRSNGNAYPNGAREGATPQSPARLVETVPVEVDAPITRHDLSVIQFFNRVDRLFSDQVDAREREIHAKDRLITELERRAQQAEEHATLLHEYIKNLTPGNEYQSTGDGSPGEKPGRARWRFWR